MNKLRIPESHTGVSKTLRLPDNLDENDKEELEKIS